MPNIFTNTRFDFFGSGKTRSAATASGDVPLADPPAAAAATTTDAGTTDSVARMHRTLCSGVRLVAAWLGLGAVAVLLPMYVRHRRVSQFRYYNYDYNGNQNQNNQYQQGDWDANGCKWYQFGCSSFYVDENGNARDDQGGIPSWYSGWGQSEQQREDAVENGQTPTGLRFVYLWQLAMFIGILFYGYNTISHRKSTSSLVAVLLIWANFNFLSMWMLANGAIAVDGRGLEMSGFYGQFSVLMFMTDFWYTMFGIIFMVYFFKFPITDDAASSSATAAAAAKSPEQEMTSTSSTNKDTYTAPTLETEPEPESGKDEKDTTDAEGGFTVV